MEASARAYAYVPGEAELRWFGETATRFLATGALTGGAFALVDERASHGESVPLHRHADDVESFYVVEGEMSFHLAEDVVTCGPGSFVHVPAGAIHGFRIESDTARYLILTTARHGDFYRAISVPPDPDGGPPEEAFDFSRLETTAREYGIELVGPLPDA